MKIRQLVQNLQLEHTNFPHKIWKESYKPKVFQTCIKLGRLE